MFLKKMGLSTFDAFKHLRSSEAIEVSDADLRRLQLVLAGIVADVHSVCVENGLTYMLGGGSALGARRHRGFIPWDDDVDLNLPRADYDRFVPLFRARFGEKYWIHTPVDTAGYGLALGRIRLKGTCVKTREDFANSQAECGAFVDIFIVENAPSNPIIRLMHGIGSLAIGFLYSCRKLFHERRYVRRWAAENAKMSGAFRIKLAIGFFTAFASLDFWTRLWDWWNRLCRNGESEYVTIPVGRRHYFGELAHRDGFCDTVDVEWEGAVRKAPRDLDGYMRRLYGADFMTPPPPEEREKHVLFSPFILPSASPIK
jgi:lipopolysaccharide cholinephosphotransferase